MNRFLGLFLAVLFLPKAARGEDASAAPAEASTEQVARCVSSHDSARVLRLKEEWLDARAAMSECAAPTCPLAIRADCVAWLDELSRALPTLLVLIERGDTQFPARSVRLELDGKALELSDPPAPLELLPGRHELRIKFADKREITRDLTLAQGEKNHIERIRLSEPQKPMPAPRAVSSRPVPTKTYVFSAGALAAFAGSTALLISALRERNDGLANCAPTCDHSLHRKIETKLILSDVSGGVGLALGALAIYSYVRRPTVVTKARLFVPTVVASDSALRLFIQGQF